MSHVRDLASQTAQYAFTCATKAKEKNLKEYPQYVKKLPTMIRNAGFAKAFAFGYSKKDKSEGKIYEAIYKDIIKWLLEKKIITKEMPTEVFIQTIIEMDTDTYRRAINETMKLLDWLRRFAEGMFESKGGICMNLHIKGLNYKTTETTLHEEFAKFGKIKSCKIIKDRDTGRSRGFGFIEFENSAAGEEAIQAMNNKEIDGRKIGVSEAEDRRGNTTERRDTPQRNETRPPAQQHNSSPQTQNHEGLPEMIIPEKTQAVLNGISADNFHLRVNTFAKYGKPEKEKDDNKKKFLIEKVDIKDKLPTHNIANNYLSSAKELHKNIRVFNSTTDSESRLIVGIGSESVYEVGITLHHIYGIPYIPGQAVKGITRSWYIAEKFGNNENEAMKSKLFTTLFGGENNQGNIIFHDVFPIEDVKMELDIMNPHYGDYYQGQGKTPPADYLSPSPIKFLTVAPNTEFQFILSSKNKVRDRYLLVAECIVKHALTDHGIGAKTAVGYGYFRENQ